MIRDLIRGIRAARDDDHDNELPTLERLQIRQRRQQRESGNDDERCPERKRLQIPGKSQRAVAPGVNVTLVGRYRVRERPGTDDGDCIFYSIVIGDPVSGQGDGGRQTGGQSIQSATGRRIQKKVEVIADLKTKTLHIFRSATTKANLLFVDVPRTKCR